MLKRILLTSIALGCLISITAQEIQPRGYFSQDTLKIGEVVNYTLIIDYPRGMEVLLPDSTFLFTPFEYVDRSYVSTESTLSASHDSVVYQLATFELDSVQKLALPVFVITDGDSTTIKAPIDSVLMQFVLTTAADSIAIKDTAQYQEVSKAFNYPYLLIALGILLVIIVLVLAIFGKQLRTRLKLYRMRKAHEKFIAKFAQMQGAGLTTAEQAERLLSYWKKYLEKLDGMPYTKLTTKEIVIIGDNAVFKDTLRSLDSNIYGTYEAPIVDELSAKLRHFGVERYVKKIEEITA